MNSNFDIDKEVKLGIPAIIIVIISGILIIFSFYAPYYYVQKSKNGIDFSDTGQIGDTVGGVMNPFIAISGVLLTFLAFYIQFRANRLQRKMFRLELDEQKVQFKKNQIENQFYEMLRLHKENVNELKIENEISGFNIQSRHVFEYLIKEFELCYDVVKKYVPDEPVEVIVNEAYGVFFHGLNSELIKKHTCFKVLNEIKNQHEFSKYKYLGMSVNRVSGLNYIYELNYPILRGYSSRLGHYYRHLFLTVKFIVSQDAKLISYEDKREYLRVLRAQLSSQEQVMLFYNWFSKFGRQWENDTNRFITDYRMIHNIYQSLLIPDIELSKIFDLTNNYKKEKNREVDHLFEFQDWD